MADTMVSPRRRRNWPRPDTYGFSTRRC